MGLRKHLATELISRTTCKCPKVEITDLDDFFLAPIERQKWFQKPPSYGINFQDHLQVSQSENYGFGEFFPRTNRASKMGLRKHLATELISRTTCKCPKVKITDLENFFLAPIERQKWSQKPPSY